jgi:hypothetical protein
MLRTGPRVSLVLVIILGLVAIRVPNAAAAGATFIVTVKSAYLTVQPGFGAEHAYSVFRGQRFSIVGRTGDNLWVQLDFAGAQDRATWIYVNYGSVEGSLAAVPEVVAEPVPAATAAPATLFSTGTGASHGSVEYIVAVKSFFGLSAPDLQSDRLVSLFRGQAYTATGRNADGSWVLLALGGNSLAWAPTSYGATRGQVVDLPLTSASSPARTPVSPPAAAGPVLPTVSADARAIYQIGLTLGNNPHAFSKLGDCNSVAPFFLAPFDIGQYRLGPAYAYLQATIDNFAGSFARDGAAAHDGLNVMSMFDPIWANPALCSAGESPLACEVRVQRPSIAIVSLGTNGGWQTDAQYETYMRRILDYLIQHGVLPILSTKVDNLEGGDRFNQIVVRLAGEYRVPLWNFALAGRALPGQGLADSYHLTWGRPFYDTVAPLWLGWQVRNLTALQALDGVWQGVR